MVEGALVGINLAGRHAVAGKEFVLVERRIDMVDKVAVCIDHYAGEVKVNILYCFAKAKESAGHNRAPVAAHAEVGELGAVAFLEVDTLAFFKTYCHDDIWFN